MKLAFILLVGIAATSFGENILVKQAPKSQDIIPEGLFRLSLQSQFGDSATAPPALNIIDRPVKIEQIVGDEFHVELPSFTRPISDLIDDRH